MAELQGCHALKQFVRKGGMSFSRISHTRCLSGFAMCCKKNCRINVQCRRKNVIIIVYGKSDCGPCPAADRSKSSALIASLPQLRSEA